MDHQSQLAYRFHVSYNVHRHSVSVFVLSQHLFDAEQKNAESQTEPVERTHGVEHYTPCRMEGKSLCHKTSLWNLFPSRFIAVEGNFNSKWHLRIQAHRPKHFMVAIQMSLSKKWQGSEASHLLGITLIIGDNV